MKTDTNKLMFIEYRHKQTQFHNVSITTYLLQFVSQDRHETEGSVPEIDASGHKSVIVFIWSLSD